MIRFSQYRWWPLGSLCQGLQGSLNSIPPAPSHRALGTRQKERVAAFPQRTDVCPLREIASKTPNPFSFSFLLLSLIKTFEWSNQFEMEWLQSVKERMRNIRKLAWKVQAKIKQRHSVSQRRRKLYAPTHTCTRHIWNVHYTQQKRKISTPNWILSLWIVTVTKSKLFSLRTMPVWLWPHPPLLIPIRRTSN